MRICLFTPNFLPAVGGTEQVTAALAGQFFAKGHFTAVLALGKRGQKLGLPYPVSWYTKPLLPRVWPERIGRALRKLHAQHRFDVFVANYGCPTGYAAIRLGRRVGVPTVVISHGGDLYKTSRDRRRPHTWKRTLYAYRHAEGLVAISPYIESLIRRINPSPRRLVSIPNGIDVADLNDPAPRPDDFPPEHPFCLCLGNLGPLKGFGDALAAYAQVRAELGDMQLVVVGSGKEEAALRHQTREAGLNGDVHFMGQRTGPDKRWFLQHCHFGLMPSIEEGHPLVALEFLAAGKPLICSTNASFDGVVDDGINGLRVRASDPEALAAAMRRMAASNLTALGAASRRRADEYDWTLIADKYLQFFESLRS